MDLTHDIIEYVNCCVGAFANRFKLTLYCNLVLLQSCFIAFLFIAFLPDLC